MADELFSLSERNSLDGVPDQVDLTAFWLSEHDRTDVVGWRRSDPGRIAAGIQIGALRALGFTPADLSTLPVEAVQVVANQLGLDAGLLGEYMPPDRTLRNHIAGVERHAQASHPDRTVQASMCAGPVLVNANDDLLRQVFTNIVSNAIRHTNPEAIVAVTLRIDQEMAIFEVSDDGPGMAPEVLAKATERFYRADPSRSRQRGGSGLGLAIADSVVAALEGTLKLESTLGEGTTVVVALPLANVQPTAP